MNIAEKQISPAHVHDLFEQAVTLGSLGREESVVRKELATLIGISSEVLSKLVGRPVEELSPAEQSDVTAAANVLRTYIQTLAG